MKFDCLCGHQLTDIGYPNDVEHLLLGTRNLERLQDLVDNEVQKTGIVEMWPEHWDECGATEVWKCPSCKRLYFDPNQPNREVVVYALESAEFPKPPSNV